MPKARRKPAPPPMPKGGDHGTGSPLAVANTELVPVDGDANNTYYRRRREQVEWMHKQASPAKRISLRQYQAGLAIRDAWCAVEMLSSGGELREAVDTQVNPGAVTIRQADAQSRLNNAMAAVPQNCRAVVEHICWHNLPMSDFPQHRDGAGALLKVALDLVANRLGY